MTDASEQTREFVELAVATSEAFLVDAEDGTEVGVVDKVRFDDAGRPAQIDVCGGWFGRRRRTFDLEDVVAGSPSQRLLIVSNGSAARAQEPQGERGTGRGTNL